MKKRILLRLVFTVFVSSVLFFVSQSCRHSQSGQVILPDSLIFSVDDTLENIKSPSSSGPAIYYGLYSPSDVAAIFQRNNLDMEPEILNPPDKTSSYSSTAKMAINLGVYGADLSYVKLFNDPQLTTQYLKEILVLAEKLGIPPEFLKNASLRIDKNLDNPDSLNIITGKTFEKIITFLSEQDREGSAYLMITGGWIEAMYIAVEELLKTKDPEVIRKILEQKYALDYLLSSLKNHYNEPSVAYYYRMLFVLQKYYNKTRIVFTKKGFEIDRNIQTIHYAGSTLYYNDADLVKIKNIIVSLRDIVIEE
ncbi:MAG: hypothetical protein GXO83_13565 [Chlorobi bacterium]|nr:hypothetical protein [Chlorobiota bacterium]